MSDEREWWLERLVKDAQKQRPSDPDGAGGPAWAAGVTLALFVALVLLGFFILGFRGVI